MELRGASVPVSRSEGYQEPYANVHIGGCAMDSRMPLRYRVVAVLAVVATVSTLTLLLLPATRWMVLDEMGVPLLLDNEAAERSFAIGIDPATRTGRAEVDYARAHPLDYESQLALAVGLGAAAESYDFAPAWRRLAALVPRFPNEPSLYAAILRGMVSSDIRTGRLEEEALFSPKKPAGRGPKYRNDPALLAQFDSFAAAGERLDPSNGFFPMLRASALYAAQREDEATAAEKRGVACSDWNDYRSVEKRALHRLRTAATGRAPAYCRTLEAILPTDGSYRAIGGVVRLMLAAYVDTEYSVEHVRHRSAQVDSHRPWPVGPEDERALMRAVEIALRRRMAETGVRMRDGSSDMLGALTGAAIVEQAALRPGGALQPKDKTATSSEMAIAHREAQLLAFLVRGGNHGTADWFRKQFEIGRRLRVERLDPFRQPNSMAALELAHAVGSWLLLNIVFLGFFALNRLAPGRGRLPWRDCLSAMWRSRRRLIRTISIGVMFTVTYAACGHSVGVALVSFFVSDFPHFVNAASLSGLWVALALPTVAFALALVCGAVSLHARVPLRKGVARGLHGLAAPVALLLLCLYPIAIGVALHYDAKANADADRLEQNEARFLLAYSGRSHLQTGHQAGPP
jgi:hypothetical protein